MFEIVALKENNFPEIPYDLALFQAELFLFLIFFVSISAIFSDLNCNQFIVIPTLSFS